MVLSFVMLYADDIFGVPGIKHLNDLEFSLNGATHMTIFFHTFVLLQLFNEFNCRELRANELNPFANLGRNQYFNIVMVVSILIQFAIV